MIDFNSQIFILLCLLNIVSFFIGYLIKSNNNSNIEYSIRPHKNSTNHTNQNSINIDEKKIVTKISTDNLEKKYTSLGETKNTTDNLESSINKLKNMKG